MTATSRHPRARVAAALALTMLLVALSTAVVTAVDGNNGTVKVHEGATDAERLINEESHVCTFHLHFFFADAGQSGTWWIDQAAPTGSAPLIITGTYSTDANGEYQTVELGAPIGHYSLSWEGRDDQNVKSKTFWVTCENAPGPIGGIG